MVLSRLNAISRITYLTQRTLHFDVHAPNAVLRVRSVLNLSTLLLHLRPHGEKGGAGLEWSMKLKVDSKREDTWGDAK